MVPMEEFIVHGLPIFPFPVMHGEDMHSMGFLIGKERATLCYISDISRMLPSSLASIMDRKSIDLLVVDALAIDYRHPTHFSLEQAIDLARTIKPKKTLLVGMGSGIEHDEVNQRLRELFVQENIDIELAYDGLNFDIDL
jgi:phosphoribosyl 1,2-cyclic phosphate phosphodiesterase